jgi:hypothetical protein
VAVAADAVNTPVAEEAAVVVAAVAVEIATKKYFFHRRGCASGLAFLCFFIGYFD